MILAAFIALAALAVIVLLTVAGFSIIDATDYSYTGLAAALLLLIVAGGGTAIGALWLIGQVLS